MFRSQSANQVRGGIQGDGVTSQTQAIQGIRYYFIKTLVTNSVKRNIIHMCVLTHAQPALGALMLKQLRPRGSEPSPMNT